MLKVDMNWHFQHRLGFLVLIFSLVSMTFFGCSGGSDGEDDESPRSVVLNVDDFGASPLDTLPDSEAIQACIDQAASGDQVTFTSGVDSPNYQGYLIDKTIFLIATTAKNHLTFTSTDPNNHAVLKADASLKGYVVRLFARSRVVYSGDIDSISLTHLDIDGSRDVRFCLGSDGIENGLDDNWGSWLPECTVIGDAWCMPGSVAMDGEMDWEDTNQDYDSNPAVWSTDMMVEDVRIMSTECGSALALGGAHATIRNVTIINAGDHTHGVGCASVDDEDGIGDWSDGITFTGPAHIITGNTITNASDVGIVFFGGKDTVISNNTINSTEGNNGMFAGIAIHPWIFGDISGTQVTDNQVTNESDSLCGGIHCGINVGQHMWGGGCVTYAHSSAIGNPGQCIPEPQPPGGTLCSEGELCQEWAHVAAGRSLTLKGNHVSGAHVNYLIEGLDLVGSLFESNNTSNTPRPTDWESAVVGCEGIQWNPIDRIAHHPSLDGWTDLQIHCER
jgi:parallel beta-helix repeat protein